VRTTFPDQTMGVPLVTPKKQLSSPPQDSKHSGLRKNADDMRWPIITEASLGMDADTDFEADWDQVESTSEFEDSAEIDADMGFEADWEQVESTSEFEDSVEIDANTNRMLHYAQIAAQFPKPV